MAGLQFVIVTGTQRIRKRAYVRFVEAAECKHPVHKSLEILLEVGQLRIRKLLSCNDIEREARVGIDQYRLRAASK